MPRILFFVLSLVASLPVFAHSRATMTFLTLPSSPTANGYGGVLLPTALNDPLAALVNPAALGLQAQQSRGNAAFYPQRTQWAPSFDFSPHMRYSARALNLGMGTAILGRWLHHPTRFSVGVGYNEILFDYGETTRRNQYNEPVGSSHPLERMNGLSLGIGYHGDVEAALGFSVKYVTSDFGETESGQMKDAVFSHDIGGTVQWPLLGRSSADSAPQTGLTPYVTPAFSYSITNIGPAVNYLNQPAQGDPQPRTEHVTFGLASGITLHEADQREWRLISLELGLQAEDELITYEEYYHYQWPFADINPLRDMLLGKANDRILKRRGGEVSLLEIFSIRRGSVEATGDHLRYDSRGFGIRLSGVLKLAEHFGSIVWSDRFDIEYSESEFSQAADSNYLYPAYDGMRYRQISLYWR